MSAETRPYANRQFPLRLSIEPREQIPRWLPAAISFGAVVLALIIGAVILALAGGNPLAAYAQIARSSFGGIDVFSDTLVKATPLIMVGLACTLAFRMRLWNIGAEGQFFMGAWGASAVVLLPLVGKETPRWAAIALMLLA